MQVDLDKKDLICLLTGIAPNYSHIEDPLLNQCGKYIGGMEDNWQWDAVKLHEQTSSMLWKMYKICKKSWEDG